MQRRTPTRLTQTPHSSPFPSPLVALLALCTLLASCAAKPRAGDAAPRLGDEIVVCGQFVHTGAPVVLWLDPGGYDAYRVEKRFVPWETAGWPADTKGAEAVGGTGGVGGTGTGVASGSARTGGPSTPNRYGVRFGEAGKGVAGSGARLDDTTLERVRGGGWELHDLQQSVDQFVIHYDVCGTSRACFRVLHDVRGLSVHFMLDVDGTIYQTLDLKERAWHATTSNDRSIGIEIAQIGAYPPLPASAPDTPVIERLPSILRTWYTSDPAAGAGGVGGGGATRITFPPAMADGGVRTPGFVPRPARPEPIIGTIQNQTLVQYDFTPEQYESLEKLTAALCTVFPNMPCDFPRDANGDPLNDKLPDEQLASYRGLLGHYHIQANKTDPGPAFDWSRVVTGARRRMR